MPLNVSEVTKLFNLLKIGNNELFFENVADDVSWTVMGTHPLAGEYKSKDEFLSNTYHRLDKVLKEGVILKVNNVIVQGDYAVVEMESLSTALNGKPFNNTYCWVVHFKENIIIRVRAYLDSALVQKLFDENG
jgi:ketosteroid isomerase-like protein